MTDTLEERSFILHTHERIQAWARAQDKPFDHEDIAKACTCSEGYAAASMRKHFKGGVWFIRRHVGSGNFRVTYFPLHWSQEECQAWMDSKVKAGKSKATLGLLG